MIPVTQTKFRTATSNGNCLRACIASILEIDIDSIPFFEDMGDNPDWFVEFRNWAEKNGHGTVNVVHWSNKPKGWSIACGFSPMAFSYHAVVAKDGDVYFDPHPERRGLGDIERYWVFSQGNEEILYCHEYPGVKLYVTGQAFPT